MCSFYGDCVYYIDMHTCHAAVYNSQLLLRYIHTHMPTGDGVVEWNHGACEDNGFG